MFVLKCYNSSNRHLEEIMKKKNLLLPTLSTLLLSSFVLANQVSADETGSTNAVIAESVADTDTVVTVESPSPTETSTSDSVSNTTSSSEEVVKAETTSLTTESSPAATSTSSEASTSQATTASDTITILHTNDIHGRIVEAKDVIGTAKLSEVVNETRAQGTTLVFDSGDAIQGLPITNSTKGEDMITLMNAIGYDAMTLGNHEFDFGLDQIKKLHERLQFPLISSNVYVNGARLFEASTIVDKTPGVDGDEFVVIGVTTPETATKTHPRNVADVTFTDPITEVNTVIAEIEAKAKAEGKVYNNYVILAHLGIDTTTPTEWQGSTLAKALSENKLLEGKKVIVLDGHSHTLSTATYGNVTYNQTGSYLNNIGKITLNSEKVLSQGVINTTDGKAYDEDPKVAALVKEIKAKYDAENAVVVLDNSPVELNGQRENVRVRETNLGNVVADALLDYGQTGFSHPTNLAVTNGGGLRETIAKNKAVTKGDIIAVLPFGNIISQITVTGQNIKDMFVKSLGSILQVDSEGKTIADENGQPLLEPSGGFLQIAGAKVYYDTTLEAANRILDIKILDPETKQYLPLDLTKTYYLATNDFLAAGGDGYTMLGGAREEGVTMDTILASYLAKADLTQYATINPNSRAISISTADYATLKAKEKEANQSKTVIEEYVPTSETTEIFNTIDLTPSPKKDRNTKETIRHNNFENAKKQLLTKNDSTNPNQAKEEQVETVTYKSSYSLPNTGEISSQFLLALGFSMTVLGSFALGYGKKHN